METGYITSAAKSDQLPLWAKTELCFVGRSNAGKSSLLNAITEHKGLARASSTPGRTQMVNLFYMRQGLKQIVLADLPGYGFTKSGGANSKHWENLVAAYLTRPQIHHCFFLKDIRRDFEALDLDALLLLTRRLGANVSVILTKADKVNQSQRSQAVRNARELLGQELAHQTGTELQVLATSCTSRLGMAELKALVKSHLEAAEIDHTLTSPARVH